MEYAPVDSKPKFTLKTGDILKKMDDKCYCQYKGAQSLNDRVFFEFGHIINDVTIGSFFVANCVIEKMFECQVNKLCIYERC